VRLRLTDVDAAAGSTFWVRSASESVTFDASLAHDGTLWTPSVDGPLVTLDVEGAASFTISAARPPEASGRFPMRWRRQSILLRAQRGVSRHERCASLSSIFASVHAPCITLPVNQSSKCLRGQLPSITSYAPLSSIDTRPFHAFGTSAR
jgi:hypothetical protein